MTTRKRNQYLEGDASEEELENGYDSEAVEESRGAIGGHAIKRRKVDQDSDADSLDGLDEDDDDALQEDDHAAHHAVDGDEDDAVNAAPKQHEKTTLPRSAEKTAPALKLSTPKQVAAAQKAAQRTGVIYISRVPPFMKPQTLKHFLAPHASKGLGRVFLTPEDHASHTRRVKSGGNKKKSFTDGWVEFVSKKDAKMAAETLNGNIIGGKKGNFYHDDLWNIKYLKGFKWSHLTEQIANENAERQARLREEIRRTRKENKAFLDDVERGKMLEGMEIKKKAKLDRQGVVPTVAALRVREDLRPGREFKQRKVEGRASKDGGKEQPDEVKRVLSKIF